MRIVHCNRCQYRSLSNRFELRLSKQPFTPVSMTGTTDTRQRLGLLGERIAARYLVQNGWEIVAHRYRAGRRDVDLIAKFGDTIAFVEVKCRRSEAFGTPVEAVNHRKQRELSRAVSVWVDRHGSDKMTYRFDVVGVLIIGQNVRIRHVANAFNLKIS